MSLLIGLDRLLGLLGRGAEVEQTPAEGDGTDGEPRPSERQPGQHISEPVTLRGRPGWTRYRRRAPPRSPARVALARGERPIPSRRAKAAKLAAEAAA